MGIDLSQVSTLDVCYVFDFDTKLYDKQLVTKPNANETTKLYAINIERQTRPLVNREL